MRKIKFAGLAAATLLALTPATTTTFASSTNGEQVRTSQSVGASNSLSDIFNTVKGVVDKIIQAVQNNNKPAVTPTPADNAVAVLNGLKNVNYDENHPVLLKSSEVSKYYGTITGYQLAELLHLLNLTTQTQGQTIDTSGLSYSIGSDGLSTGDLNKKIDNILNGNGLSVKLTITAKDSSGNVKASKDIIFTNNTKTISQTNNLKIDYKTPINVAVGSNTIDLSLSGSGMSNTTVTDNNGNNVAYSADPGQFYSNADNARDFKNPINLNGKFTQKGAKYYQPVTLDFGSNSGVNVYQISQNVFNYGSSVFKLNGNNVVGNQINQNGKTNSVTYVREITVGVDQPNSNNNNNNQNNNNNNQNNNQNPAPSVGVWKSTDQSGVLTVNSSVADLVDGSSSYTARSLAPNSRWVTDQYRVNSATGQKQYHVSTNEWVDASDVTFRDQATRFFTNVLQLPGFQTVSLAGPDAFIYQLFNQDGIRVDRGLPGNTAWATDQRATDAQGNIYYRVSTNEWILRGNGVSVY
ncbi:hypothetical protein [Companilactobacillus ginsenosidimutans]|uniref:Surface layer protein A domain-containing protein n=1 Tax=Companilactobacillus ginsenosidimutans TaxID=1007676 RepID=A0A0H4QFQ2_9LACO|nr:hypothetical protein [Companilactobacillus ginsenosidimutans]AKP67244.1 hypothetical protein ABM34_06625 [Companilactobacillus ginsenosidimutans]